MARPKGHACACATPTLLGSRERDTMRQDSRNTGTRSRASPQPPRKPAAPSPSPTAPAAIEGVERGGQARGRAGCGDFSAGPSSPELMRRVLVSAQADVDRESCWPEHG